MSMASDTSQVSHQPKFVFDHVIDIIKLGLDPSKPRQGPECCIFRVPGHLRDANPEAYTPRLVSIGPMHYNNTKLKPMEKQKRIYFSFFLERLWETDLKLEKLKKYYDEELIRGQESIEKLKKYYDEELIRGQESIRDRYSEEFDYLKDRDEFANMMILDAVFIIELFLRIASRKSDNSKHKDDYMVTKAWLTKTLQRDLLLLENQLPISVLEKMYEMVPQGDKTRQEHSTFLDLAREYFVSYDPQTQEPKNSLDKQQSQHFTDPIQQSQHFTEPIQQSQHKQQLLCKMFRQRDKQQSQHFTQPIQQSPPIHFTDLIRYFYLPSNLRANGRARSGEKITGSDENIAQSNEKMAQSDEKIVIRTATKLQGSGISFEKVLKRSVLDIEFKKTPFLSYFLCLGCFPLPPFKCFEARFRIPQLNVDNNTECVLRNLIAFEQCHYTEKPYICNYVSLIDSLIHTRDDVELLVEEEVIVHELGSDKEVATLVNGLCKNVVSDSTYYKKTIDDLDKHYQSCWNRSMAALRLVYFRDPWRASSTFVGIAVLVFTIFNFCRVVKVLL